MINRENTHGRTKHKINALFFFMFMLLSGRSALDVEVEDVLRPVLGAEVEGVEAAGG